MLLERLSLPNSGNDSQSTLTRAASVISVRIHSYSHALYLHGVKGLNPSDNESLVMKKSGKGSKKIMFVVSVQDIPPSLSLSPLTILVCIMTTCCVLHITTYSLFFSTQHFVFSFRVFLCASISACTELKGLPIMWSRYLSLHEVLNAPGMMERATRKPYVLSKPDDMKWGYQNSENLKQELCKSFTNNKEMYDKETRCKNSTQQTFLCAGAGMGKTRLLTMVPTLLEAELKGKTVFTFNVSFENDTAFNRNKECDGFDAVTRRIAYHLLGVEQCYMTWADGLILDFSLHKLMYELVKGLRADKDVPRTDVVCLLMIDGVDAMGAKGEVVEPCNPVYKFLRHDIPRLTFEVYGYFFFPVCSMLRRSSVHDAFTEKWMYRRFFETPRLLTSPDPQLSNTLFDFVKGNPRAVQHLCALREKHPEKTEAELINTLSCDWEQSYGPLHSKEEQVEVLRHALLRKHVNDDYLHPISLRPIMDQGLLNIEKREIKEHMWTHIYIEPTPIWAVVNSRVPESPLAGYDCAEALDGASSYASFLVWYRSVLSKLDIDEEKVIKDNFLTRLWPSSTECSEDGEKSNKSGTATKRKREVLSQPKPRKERVRTTPKKKDTTTTRPK